MKQPFYEAANAVIKMYSWRQERSSKECPAHSPSEINHAVDKLLEIVSVARYVGSAESVAISQLADFWKKNKHLRLTPALFPIEDVEVSQ